MLLALLFVGLCNSTTAETWFTPSTKSHETLDLLREMFQPPQREWKSILAERQDLLDDHFFESVRQRIQWGIHEGHTDDAARFAYLGDVASAVKGRRGGFRRDLDLRVAPRRSGFEFPDHPDAVIHRGSSWFFGLDAETMEQLAPWKVWPSSNKRERRQKAMLAEVMRKPISEWESALQSQSNLLNDKFFEIISERLESDLIAWERDRAICLALMGDTASRLQNKKHRFGLRLALEFCGSPTVIDRRDGTILAFPRPAY